MKRNMNRLFFALSFLLCLCTVKSANAGVPCSVPFNLTNGTTADATQVMANYNAILSCLATSTAASGANTDITSLGGLVPPITGLCGVSGFNAVNNPGSPNTQINITYTQASVGNTANQVQTGGPASLTLNLGTAGAANGLDTGSLAASSFYYIYLIGNGSSIASLGSTSATTPVLPSGYSYKCRVGVWETGNTSLLLKLQAFGRRTALLQSSAGTGSHIAAGALQTNALIGSCGGSSLVLTTFSGIPPTASRVFGILNVANGTPTYVSSFSNALDANSFSPGASLQTTNFISPQFDLILPSAQQFYACNDSSSGDIIIGGWDDGVPAN